MAKFIPKWEREGYRQVSFKVVLTAKPKWLRNLFETGDNQFGAGENNYVVFDKLEKYLNSLLVYKDGPVYDIEFYHTEVITL